MMRETLNRPGGTGTPSPAAGKGWSKMEISFIDGLMLSPFLLVLVVIVRANNAVHMVNARVPLLSSQLREMRRPGWSDAIRVTVDSTGERAVTIFPVREKRGGK